MTDRRRSRAFVPLFVSFMGFIAFSNAMRNPRVGALHAVDILQLLAAGMCFGAAIAGLAVLVRDRRSGAA